MKFPCCEAAGNVIRFAHTFEHLAYDRRLAAFRGNLTAFAFTDKFADAFNYYQQHDYTDFPIQNSPTADVLVDDRFVFELGGISFEIIAVPGAARFRGACAPSGKVTLGGSTTAPPLSYTRYPSQASPVISWIWRGVWQQYCNAHRGNSTPVTMRRQFTCWILSVTRVHIQHKAANCGIEIHESLLEKTDNFWLCSWLKNQIKLLTV